MRVLSVVSGPSGLVQVAPVARALEATGAVEHAIIHAGRHDNPRLAEACKDLELPVVRYHLEVGDGALGVQTGLTLQRLDPALTELQPDVVLAYGDDDAAMVAALATGAHGIRFGHVEAGLRRGEAGGGDAMSTLVADRLADVLFAPSRDAIGALKAEGVAEERIQFVGSVRVDALRWAMERSNARAQTGCIVARLENGGADVAAALEELGRLVPVITAPDAYRERVGLVAGAALVITDTDDLQEETSYLGIPCITLRSDTDHPTTCQHGTNRLVAAGRETLLAAADRALSRRPPARPLIERWDGRAAERIARVVCEGVDFPAEQESMAAARGRRAMALPRLA
ncbi:MAG TPA: UDP-N-acetylglucosamine 2-epimerase [Gemmatimonadales bacterium]|jgi:UDP-N-acetylglucosamine 2-epimerase (non-hydrolysing)|nr:UDP-N-acetylglucosamine 2-epimerase [Gemmatimonadales bacterium]